VDGLAAAPPASLNGSPKEKAPSGAFLLCVHRMCRYFDQAKFCSANFQFTSWPRKVSTN
jgi:hypothetical protein